VLQRALAIREKTLPPDDRDLIATLKQLGDLFAAQGRYQEAPQYHHRVPPPPAPALGAYRRPGDVSFAGQQILVFFATNRERTGGESVDFGSQFGARRGVGYAIVDLTGAVAARKTGEELIRVANEKTLSIDDVRLMDERAILNEVRPRIERATKFKREAFVFVHGYYVSFDNALRRTAQLAHDLNFDGAAFLYSWPSHGQLADYAADQNNSRGSVHDLRQFLEFVVAKSGATTVHLIAHSMGNPLLLAALEEFRSSPAWADLHIGQVILAAPDMSTEDFSSATSDLKSQTGGVTLYASHGDLALVVSEAWNGLTHGIRGPRAGFVPAKGPLVLDGVNTIDVSGASTAILSFNHSTYAESPELLADIAMLLHGARSPDKRSPPLQRLSTDHGTYWHIAQ
jgi:esterase/lipase superfamily enzyme